MLRFLTFFMLILFPVLSFSQERTILVPKPVAGTPFKINDTNDLFGQAYRWFIEGDYARGADSLRQLVEKAGVVLDKDAYYMVVANFTDAVSPIGIFHGSDNFFSRRMYGLQEDNLYYIYISRQREGKSFLSVLATAKNSPFAENLPLFLGLFPSLPIISAAEVKWDDGNTTWVDVRRFDVPKAFQKFCDLSVIVKSELAAEKVLAKTVFDNTSKERLSYGIATAITSANDVDLVVGNDGKITVRPKPNLDLAAFAVINLHLKPVDTKQPTLASSFHWLFGLRLSDVLEPIVGIGGGADLGMFGLHVFAGYSVEFAQKLKAGYDVGDVVASEVNPFKLKIRGKPRFGIEIKFP